MNDEVELKVGFEATPEEDEEARKILLTGRLALLAKEPFFGNMATRLELVNADKWLPTCATDGRRFYYNTDFVRKLPPRQMMFVFAHEVLHCVYEHMNRGKGHDRNLSNIAADYVVNADLIEHRIGDVVTVVKPLYESKYSGWTYEEVYRDLYDKAEKIDISSLLQQVLDEHLDGADDGDGEGKGPKPDPNGVSGPYVVSDEEREAIKDSLREAIVSAAEAAKAANAGNLPANIARMIKDFTEPQIDWRDLLDSTLKSTIKSDFSFMRPSRKSWHINAVLPGMIAEDTIDVVVAIDTSGSISEGMVMEFLSEVKGIMDQYTDFHVTVLCFDTEVDPTGVVSYTSENSHELEEYRLTGGGGTDFDAVYNFLKDNGVEPKQLVMFTDGYPWNSWGDENYCDTCFIIHTNNRQGAPVPPFGSHAYYIPGQGI